MRICSLVPGATEVVAALGLADKLVGISHECDYPESVRHAPVLVEPLVGGDGIASDQIDRQVKTLVSSGRHLYRLNERAFADACPDTILTQDLCHVCAVTPDQLSRAIRSLPSTPEMVTLNPTNLEDVIADVERIGTAVGAASKGKDFAASLRDRLDAVRRLTASSAVRPRILCIEWLAPLYVGGHWVPEMVEAAGGQDLFGQVHQPSREVTWDEVRTAEPDIAILMPCGLSVERTMTELQSLCRTSDEWSRALATWPRTYVVDAASYFSRPGPRLIDGVELLADIFSGKISNRFDQSIVRAVTGASLTASPSP
jgi:iron complex transport system substrate-binding protein